MTLCTLVKQVLWLEEILPTTYVRTTLDLIQVADEQSMDAIIVFLDFEKTFDRVELSSLWGTLRYFNFGEDFITWTKLLDQDFESYTIIEV